MQGNVSVFRSRSIKKPPSDSRCVHVHIFRWGCRAAAVKSASLVGSVYRIRTLMAALSVSVQD